MKLLLLVVLQGMISQIVVVSRQNSSITTKLLFDHIQYYCYQLNGFLFYKTVFKEEEYDDPDIDVSDIFDGDDEGDQNKKPRAKGYPSGTITIYSQEDKDEHRKRKADEQLLDSLQCEDDKDPNKKPRGDNSGKG